jgi:hypothetical protein
MMHSVFTSRALAPFRAVHVALPCLCSFHMSQCPNYIESRVHDSESLVECINSRIFSIKIMYLL